ncbi:DCL family protein [Xanthomonas translucens]|uniref:DCL family protein n=1 Tax=Xanthomonas campestris pv. translucens TaxID=343 RepID=UPI0009C125A2|nr:DCL family protein [Xanthomonas translucens]MCT8276058.1 DCL family protein [Xanthomonas translucens pv. translucens]MCT8277132.1 DCL family protein [Xanthomonas translucens pv. translucens]MCT8308852.1 DCL family protein [Xanthomonas translucens pv. translucens]WNJ25925.1 DCL family protein [Xanthomonas translucens pv. translucens]
MTKSVQIGSRKFEKQKEALAFFKNMLGIYHLGERVSVEDSADLIALLDRHKHREEKVGAGVDHFVVDADEYGKSCFWIVRVDSTRVNFTYIRCVTGIW